jgi:hypothetical protein
MALLEGAAKAKSGSEALIVVLGLGIAYFYTENRSLRADIKKKDEKMDKIIDEYYKGNMTLTEALNSLKLVLYELKGKFRV